MVSIVAIYQIVRLEVLNGTPSSVKNQLLDIISKLEQTVKGDAYTSLRSKQSDTKSIQMVIIQMMISQSQTQNQTQSQKIQ
jgi:hypothetical protein